MKPGDDINAVLDQALELAEFALVAHEQMQSKVAQLEGEKITLEKVASEPPFNSQIVDKALNRLVNLGLINPEVQIKLATELNSNPDSVFRLLERISDTLLIVPGDGQGIAKGAGSDDTSSDPDGWHAFAEGRPVAIKKH